MCEVYSGQPEKWECPNMQTKKQPSPGSRGSLTGASWRSWTYFFVIVQFGLDLCAVLCASMFGSCQRLIPLGSLGKIKIFD